MSGLTIRSVGLATGLITLCGCGDFKPASTLHEIGDTSQSIRYRVVQGKAVVLTCSWGITDDCRIFDGVTPLSMNLDDPNGFWATWDSVHKETSPSYIDRKITTTEAIFSTDIAKATEKTEALRAEGASARLEAKELSKQWHALNDEWEKGEKKDPKPPELDELNQQWVRKAQLTDTILGNEEKKIRGKLDIFEERLEALKAKFHSWRAAEKRNLLNVKERSEAFVFLMQSSNYVYDLGQEFQDQIEAMEKIFNLENAKSELEKQEANAYRNNRAALEADIRGLTKSLSTLQKDKLTAGEAVRPLRERMEKVTLEMVENNCLSDLPALRGPSCVSLQNELNGLVRDFDEKETRRRQVFADYQTKSQKLELLQSSFLSYDKRHLPTIGFTYNSGPGYIVISDVVAGSIADAHGLEKGHKIFTIGFSPVNGSRTVQNPILGTIIDVKQAMFDQIGRSFMILSIDPGTGARVGVRISLKGASNES